MPLIGSNLPHSVVEEGIMHRVFPLTRKKNSHAMKLTASALVLSEISSLALRHLAPPAAGLYKTRKEKTAFK